MQKIQRRQLGNTGLDVSILALGGVKYNFLPDAEAAAVVHRAIDLGINYIDTAFGYKDSEQKIGQVMPERREEVILATKTIMRDRDGAAAELEQSFKRLRTEYIDIVQIHDLHSEQDFATITEPGGALEALVEARDAGRIGFIGVTSHVDPHILAMALREWPFDTLLCALGAVHESARPFYDIIMPAAQERGVGVLGMKVLAYGFLEDRVEHALRFVMGMPGVTSAVVGVDTIEQLEQLVAVAKAYAPLSDEERAKLLADAHDIYTLRKEDAWFIFPEAQPIG